MSSVHFEYWLGLDTEGKSSVSEIEATAQTALKRQETDNVYRKLGEGLQAGIVQQGLTKNALTGSSPVA